MAPACGAGVRVRHALPGNIQQATNPGDVKEAPRPVFITRSSVPIATPMSDTITVHADSGHAERTPNPDHEIVWGATDALGGMRR